MGYGKIHGQKNVGDLITILGYLNPEAKITLGGKSKIGYLRSYRGYYEDLALIVAGSSETTYIDTAGELLEILKNAVGTTFEGYKGGDYVADLTTPIWVATGWSTLGDGLVGVSIEVDGNLALLTYPEDDSNRW